MASKLEISVEVNADLLKVWGYWNDPTHIVN